VLRGVDNPELDLEGRVLAVEFAECWVMFCYIMNSGMKLERLGLRTGTFDPAFRRRVTQLQTATFPESDDECKFASEKEPSLEEMAAAGKKSKKSKKQSSARPTAKSGAGTDGSMDAFLSSASASSAAASA